MNSTTAGQAPNEQTFSATHYFTPHDEKPSLSSVTSWMNEPEFYVPWSARTSASSKGSHLRCLSANVRLNDSNLQSFSLVMSPVIPHSIEATHTSHVHSISSAPSSGSDPSGEPSTRLKLVTCDLTPNERRVEEPITSTAYSPSSEIPGHWEEYVDRLGANFGNDDLEEQPSEYLDAKATRTQHIGNEWSRLYSNEEHVPQAYFDSESNDFEEWEGHYSAGPTLILTKLSPMEDYEHFIAAEINMTPQQWTDDLWVPDWQYFAWSDESTDSDSDCDSPPPQTPTQPLFEPYHTLPVENEEEWSPVSLLESSNDRVKPVAEFKPIGFRWSEYPDDDDGLPELPTWA
ncbi:hypothetical protein M413DRAFT_441505 [Hebeloma cylindrosporum]|uniref:Uncharacterized protein n=1 Tax=Hebeloma cylindrosporum TaxID=76867 RepID=A0A0C2YZK9_HEBCY|nr:hypothetical protein M413DRAFT_441505 [Hebeloma cylindrosporum h7]